MLDLDGPATEELIDQLKRGFDSMVQIVARLEQWKTDIEARTIEVDRINARLACLEQNMVVVCKQLGIEPVPPSVAGQ